MALVDTWMPDEDPVAPRRPGKGCLIAAIVTAVGAIVLVLLAANALVTAFEGVKIR
jgi:hypothetical protein